MATFASLSTTLMRFVLAACLLAISPASFAQTAVGGGTPSSARQVAASGASSFLPSDDPLAFQLNPALLPGTRDGFALSGGTASLGVFSGATDRRGVALTYGRDVDARGLGIRVGAGLSVSQFANSFLVTNDRGEALGDFGEDEYGVAFSAGGESTGPLRLALGGTARLLSESRGFRGSESTGGTTFSADLGTLATADLAALTGLARASGVVPALEVSAGYAVQNLGASREIEYPFETSFPVRAPLSRQAALGWSASVGADLARARGRLPLVHLRVDLEATSSLLDYDFVSSTSAYDGPLGFLNVGDALLGRGSETQESCGANCTSFRYTTGRRSLTVEALGAAHVTFGAQNIGDDGPTPDFSWGLGVEPLALVRAVQALRGAPAPSADRYAVRFDYGRYLNDPQQIIPEPVARGAFTLTLGWRP